MAIIKKKIISTHSIMNSRLLEDKNAIVIYNFEMRTDPKRKWGKNVYLRQQHQYILNNI